LLDGDDEGPFVKVGTGDDCTRLICHLVVIVLAGDDGRGHERRWARAEQAARHVVIKTDRGVVSRWRRSSLVGRCGSSSWWYAVRCCCSRSRTGGAPRICRGPVGVSSRSTTSPSSTCCACTLPLRERSGPSLPRQG
jgi:hypothetical protein